MHLAKKLGVGYVTLSTGETHGDASVIGDDTELVNIIRELGSVAKELGLEMAIETHGNNYATGRSIIGLLKKVNIPNVRLNYDTGNVVFYGATEPYDDLDASTGSIIGIHLKEKLEHKMNGTFQQLVAGILILITS